MTQKFLMVFLSITWPNTSYSQTIYEAAVEYARVISARYQYNKTSHNYNLAFQSIILQRDD